MLRPDEVLCPFCHQPVPQFESYCLLHGCSYDPPSADWVDTTTIGSSHQIEIDTNRVGHYRHRDYHGGPWKKGLPQEKEDPNA